MAFGSNGEIFQNFEGVDTLNAGVAGVQKQMNSILDGIEAQVARLDDSWEGKANEAYADTQRRWSQARLGLNQVLAEISGTVGRGNEQMQITERMNAARHGG
ncbi:WXG100 family type VII secretion target [Rhodococcus sp. NPDC060086]|uniref:WXG100 family type VII secretion target n=1 Tax=unclassified Rhodococcus (in: high G+C Gram-positive bacteria) TaxID=192944 RepID=UPI003654C165